MTGANQTSSTVAEPLRFALPTGVEIAADRFGDPAAPSVLFLHGGGQTRHAWGSSAAHLAELGYQTITMDHRGHGESSWDAGGNYELDAFVTDLLHVIEMLESKPILVGASLGGFTALMAEAQSEESIAAGVVLVDVTPRVQRDGVLRVFDFMRGSADGFDSLEEAAAAVASYLPHRRRPKDLTGLGKNLRRSDDGRYRWHWDPKLLEVWDVNRLNERQAEALIEERSEAARRLTVPTLLIRGRMSDVVSEAQAREFLELVPHAEYVDLEGAAHMVAGDRNDVFTDAVTSFVQRHVGPGRG